MLKKDEILLTQPKLWARAKILGKTIKYNQLLTPTLTSSTSVVPSANTFGSYITILEPSLVGHKVYVKLTADDNRISLGWYKNENGVMGYDLITGAELNASSTPSATEGVYEITQDMVHSGTNYLQLYWFVYSGLPTGSHTITVQMVDLTELGMESIINPVLFNATDLGKYMQVNTLNRGSGLASGESPLNFYKQRLPQEYQEVEYIESTGTQYIDTGYKPNNLTKCLIDFKLSSISTTQGICGVGDTNISKTYRIGVSASGYFYVAKKSSQYNGQTGSSNTNRNIFEIKDNALYVNNNVIANITDTSNFQCESNFYLFYFGGSTTITKASGKLYLCKLYDNNILVRNLIPCYRKSDNAIGMYDLVNSVFYTNQGTGTFLKGNDVCITYSRTEKVDLGTLSWYYGADANHENMFTAVFDLIKAPSDNDTKANILCNKYSTETYNNLYSHRADNIIAVRNNKKIYIYSSTMGTNPTAFKNAMNGVYLEYEPAQPLVLRSAGDIQDTFSNTNGKVDRKTRIVDLGSLNYSYASSTFQFSANLLNIKVKPNTEIVNAVCSIYTPISRNDFVSDLTRDMVMRVDNSQSTPYMYFRNLSYTDPATFKQAMSGVYLVYELATPTTENHSSIMLSNEINKCKCDNGIELEIVK